MHGIMVNAFLCCKPVRSTKEWMCSTSFSITNVTTGKGPMVCSRKFSNINSLGWGEPLEPLQNLNKFEKFTIEAEITIKYSYLGQPTVPEVKPNQVIFHRLAKDFATAFKIQTSNDQADGCTWIVVGRKTDKGLEFVVTKHGPNGKLDMGLPIGAVVVTIRGPKLVETVSGDLGKTILLKNPFEDQSVVTFLIHDQPALYEPKTSKGFDFGREKLSRPAHGNVSFILKDGSKIPLNSYILAHNSPVLTNLIEEVGELDHDVSDFEAEAVRIFVDACYSGSVKMLKMETKFKVFSDFVKMVAVFKVDWAKDGCLLFYKEHLPELSENFENYWNYSLLAVDSVVKYGDTFFLDHLISKTPENLLKFQIHFFEFLANTTKQSHLDLFLVMVVEFGLIDKFVEQVLALLMVKFHIPLLNYWLENFNFSLCDEDTIIPLLAEAVDRSTNAEICCKFMAAIKTEKEEADSGKNKGGELEITVIPEDGTLATVARNHWNKVEGSTWPCSNKRPFCRMRKKLWDTDKVHNSEMEGVSNAETVKDGKKLKHSEGKFSNSDYRGWGDLKFEPLENLKKVEKYTIEAEITIKDSYLGPPTIFAEVKPNQVIFHRLAKDFAKVTAQTSSHQAYGSTWIVEGKNTNKCLEFVVTKYGSNGKLESILPKLAFTISLRGPNSYSVDTRSGDLGKTIVLKNPLEDQSVVTFLIHDQPASCEPKTSKGFNFGREKLSCPAHGNVTFILQDGSKIPLNSYILAHNSPVLTNLIEVVGELDHDVSDFDSEAVRIFVDACYSGSVGMLTDKTNFKVFSDYFKMVGVFKVDWAKDRCI
eukprot:sb/3462152/